MRYGSVAALFLVLLGAFAHAQVYTITDLGPINPTGVNTWGQVVGDNNDHAFLWARFGGMRDLGTLPGGTSSSAAAINDLGVVAGTANGKGTVTFLDSTLACSDLTQPFTWTISNGMEGLGSALPTNQDSFWAENACAVPFFALGNNLPGQVVGYNGELASFQWAFAWAPRHGFTVEPFGSFAPTSANAVSNTGQVVGQYSDSGGSGHAWSIKHGTMTDIGTLSPVPDPFFIFRSSANGVNDRGQIVGWSEDPASEASIHAVLWSPSGVIRDLGTLPGDALSDALKINFFGQVIGMSGNIETPTLYDAFGVLRTSAGVIGRPFIWTERAGMRDLNTLISSHSGWVLNSVTDINIWGQIVGSGTWKGEVHGFLLTPRVLF
jgi:probable HAF family extracellular repeat protein